MPSNHLILCHPLLLLPSIFPSIRVFSNESALRIRWPIKVLEFQLQRQSFQWIFRTDFLWDWLFQFPCSPRDSQASSLAPQFENIILWGSAFFMVQLSHSYMTTGKTIVLTRQNFIDKVMSLLFNMLSRLIIQKTGLVKAELSINTSFHVSYFLLSCTQVLCLQNLINHNILDFQFSWSVSFNQF